MLASKRQEALLMPYLNRKMRRLIHHNKLVIKHVTDYTNLQETGNSTNGVLIINGADNPVLGNQADVASKAKVRWLHIDINASIVAQVASGSARFDWQIIYDPQAALTVPAPNAVGVASTKQYIFKQGMGMVSIYSPFKWIGLVKIPKKYQVFNTSDKLYIYYRWIDATVTNFNACIKVIYKEERA